MLYTRRVLSAHDAWRDKDIVQALVLLKACPAALRGWEWSYIERLCHTGVVPTFKPTTKLPSRLGTPVENTGSIYVWATDTGKLIAELDTGTIEDVGVRFSPDGRQLETLSSFHRAASREDSGQGDGKEDTAEADQTPGLKYQLWDIESCQVVHELHDQVGVLPRIAFSRDGTRIASQRKVSFWANRVPLHTLTALLSSGYSFDGMAQLLPAERGTRLASEIVKAHPIQINAIALSPDAQRLATADDDGKIKLWDVAECRIIHDCEGHHVGPVYDLAFSPDGERLVSGGKDLAVRVWDAQTGRLMLALTGTEGHTRSVIGVAFHPDGNRVVSIGGDMAVKVWEVGCGSEVNVLRSGKMPAHAIAFHPGGKVLASAGSDGIIRFWNIDSGTLIGETAAHGGLILGLAYSPDGRYVASANHDGTLALWGG